MASPLTKEYFTIDANFPSRLLEASPSRLIQFIQSFTQDFSKRELSNRTDRSVASLSLERRIAHTIHSDSHYGVLHKFRHRMLLWQRGENKNFQVISYHGTKIPSWSWQALHGEIEFPICSSVRMEWLQEVIFGENGNVLLAEAAAFHNLTVAAQGSLQCAIINAQGNNIGWIRYDWDDGYTRFELQRCVVLGRKRTTKHPYYGLVVEPTTSADAFVRIGIVCIDGSQLVTLQGQIRVV